VSEHRELCTHGCNEIFAHFKRRRSGSVPDPALGRFTRWLTLMSATRQFGEPPSVKPSHTRIVGKLFPSDLLPALVRLFQHVSAMSPALAGYVRFHLVLDANILQGELRWRLGKREKSHARTGLHEAIMSGVLVAYVPVILEQEIMEHAEEIALDTRSSVEDVRRELKELLPLLRVYEPRAEPIVVREIVDRDDLHYIATRTQLGLRAVYTNDPHLQRMGSPVVSEQIDLFLRDYARASAVKIGITLGSTTAFVLSIETIPLLCRLLTSGISWIRRQSTGMQLAIVGIALALAVHPKSRAKFAQAWRAIAPTVGKAVRSTVVQLMCDYAESIEIEEANRLKLELAVPPQKRRTVLMYVRAVCLVKNRPMTLQQISAAIRADGYTSSSPYAGAYLKRILRNAKELAEIRPGVWILEDKHARQMHSTRFRS
jgi:hypothetical protein